VTPRRRRTAGNPAPQPLPRLDDAYKAISEFSGWVTNADTKAGLLASATTLVGGGIASQRAKVRESFRPATVADWIELIAICVSILAVLVAVVALVVVLRPQARRFGFSRFSWPAVVVHEVAELAAMSGRTQRMEAWQTAHDLAVIAQQKFRWLSVALFSWAIGAFCLLTWILLLS
jgi:hypothetical protein